MRTTDRRRSLLARAERGLQTDRLRAPAAAANAARNAGAEPDRPGRWQEARDALWGHLDPHLEAGTRIAIVGAGNGDDLPMTRIARRAGSVVLVDLDPQAARGARRRQGRRLRRRIQVIGHDISVGAADQIATAAVAAELPARIAAPAELLPGAPYDFVIGDLFYSQLLYPALADLQIPEQRCAAFLERYGPALTRSVVARMHLSAPAGSVLHIHDPLVWRAGQTQPVELAEILEVAPVEAETALRLIARGNGPQESDPRLALRSLGMTVRSTAFWRWPFAAGVDYLACATLATPNLRGSAR